MAKNIIKEKNNKKSFKLRLSKSTEINVIIKSNFVLPRMLRPLCNRSLLKKILKTPENIILAFLNLAALGFELEYAARRYPGILITEGLKGTARHEWAREAEVQRKILMELKRRRFIEEQRLGDRIVYRLTVRGNIEKLKKKLCIFNKNTERSDRKCIIIFDIPEAQHIARDTFRRFLRECGFKKLQQSVWCANEAVIPELSHFVNELGINKWVKILRVKEVL